jgi:hypothetical protein
MNKVLFLSLLLFVNWTFMRPEPQAPAAALTVNGGASATVYVGETVLFDSSGSTNTVRRTLTSNGTSPVGLEDSYYIPRIPKVAHAFRSTGTRTITVTVFNSGGTSDTEQVTVTVNALPVPTGSQLIDMSQSGACGGSCYISPANLTDASGNKTRLETALAAVKVLNVSQEAMLKVPAGAKINGPISIPVPTGNKYIFIVTTGTIPNPWNRATSSDEAQMFEIAQPNVVNDLAIQLPSGTHHWWFIGMEVVGHPTATGYRLISDPDSDPIATMSDVPHHMVFDRCYVHEGAASTMRAGFYMSFAYVSIINSEIGPFKYNSEETKGVLSVNAPGPITIYNNSIVAGSQAHLSGGVGSVSADLHPSTHAFRNNRLWHDPAWEGTFNVKYIVEVKQGDNFIYDGNIIEYSWGNPAGAGELFLFNMFREGQAYGHTQDIQVTNNWGRHGVMAYNGSGSEAAVSRVILHNNLFEDINSANWGNGAPTRGILISNHVDFKATHNTFLTTGGMAIGMYGTSSSGSVVDDNIWTDTEFEVWDIDGGAFGTTALNAKMPSGSFLNNIVAGASIGSYPATTLGPTNTEINFTNYNGGDGGNYILLSSSPGYQTASDAPADRGANITIVNAATATALNGAWGASGGGGPTGPAINTSGRIIGSGKIITRQ